MSLVKWRLVLVLLAALTLTIMPLPELFVSIRPPWVLLVILYLQFYMPDYFKVFLLFFLGLILDTLLSSVIGEHVFALCLISWLANSKARRFYVFPIGQQMTLIGILCAFYQMIVLLIDAFLGYHVSFFSVLGTGLLSVLFWPWIRLALEETLLMNNHAKT